MHPDISVVLPIYNEEENIGALLKEIASVFAEVIRKPYEIIVVDDASVDSSAAAVRGTRDSLGSSPFLSTMTLMVQHVRSGQSKALLRGMAAAQGALIITMDADLQYDPADIPRLLEKMGTYDLLCGIRKNRSDGLARRLCSKIANAFRNAITGDRIADSGCTFRVMRKQCVATLMPLDGRLFGCEFFFHPLFVRHRGFRVGESAVVHRPRRAGKSNYRLIGGRFMRGIAACILARKLLAQEAFV
jgi:dolichol-phosphate mannosyltransferase